VRALNQHPYWVELVACADLLPERAEALASAYCIPAAVRPDELLAHPSVELVINLTHAPVHAETNLAIVRAGKHLFSEKPLALARVDAASVLREAANAGLQVGGAADIYLGSALQRAKAMIAGGAIGIPVAAVSVVPTDEFRSQRYHDIFRGALLDLGPYHLGALTFLFGPVVRVAATAEVRFPEKFVLESEGGGSFPVDQATSTAGVLDLASGPVATILTSNDAHAYRPYLEVFGTEGSLSLADPVLYSGTLQHHTTTGVTNVRAATGHGFDGDARGLGVVEMAAALLGGVGPRSSGEWMYHVLDVSLAHFESSQSESHLHITSEFPQPLPWSIEDVVQR
jgi:predicted dehydrogenase